MSNIASLLETPKLVDGILTWCEKLCGRAYYPHQKMFAKRIIKAVLENDSATITALMSRQSGKSFTVSTTVTGLMTILPVMANAPMFHDDRRFQLFRDGMKIGIFAPTLNQAQIIFNNIKDYVSSERGRTFLASREFNISLETFNGNKVTLVFNNLGIKSTITCFSASEGANIEGGSYHLYICDEAQDISNYKYRKSIFPTVSFYNGTKILIGTPSIKKNFFYDTIKLNEKEYKEKKTNNKNHLEFDCDVIMKYNPFYAKTVESAKREMGENSDEFLMNYKLKWLFQFGMFVNAETFTQEPIAMKNCGRVRQCKEPCIVGIDVGKAQDSTVVTVGIPDYSHPIVLEKSKEANAEDYVLYDIRIIDWLEIVGDNYEEQYHAIVDYLKNFNVKICMIDGTGVGSPVADRLGAHVNFEVIPFVFTRPSKSMLMKYFQAHLSSNSFHYPADDETQQTIEFKKFQEQCLELTKDYSGDTLVVAAPKERNKHDDYPFSAALMVWGLKHELGSIETLDSNEFIQTNKNSFIHRGKRSRKRIGW